MSTSKEDGEYGEGEEIAFTVVYSHDMDVLGTPTIPLNSGGEASFTLGGRRQVGFEQPPQDVAYVLRRDFCLQTLKCLHVLLSPVQISFQVDGG